MTQYKSAFSTFNKWTMAIVYFVMIGGTIPVIWEDDITAFYVVITINSIILGLLTWLILQTNYNLDAKNLYYKSGPFKGTIAVNLSLIHI